MSTAVQDLLFLFNVETEAALIEAVAKFFAPAGVSRLDPRNGCECGNTNSNTKDEWFNFVTLEIHRGGLDTDLEPVGGYDADWDPLVTAVECNKCGLLYRTPAR